MDLRPEEDETFCDAGHCHICQQSLDDRIRVRDHCHSTGRFRSAAHEECNLNYQDLRTIPIIFHNLSGYDSHLIIKQILTCVDGRIDLLPLTMERYVSITKHIVGSKVTLRFIDFFRFHRAYDPDPAHYYTVPGLTCDAMLKRTGIELQLFTDIDMVLFVERGIRGGISQCNNRYSRANTPYVTDYNTTEGTTYLTYYDVNNLYGLAMMQHLPYGEFE